MSIVQLLSPTEAQRLTQRIKLTATSVRDGLFKLRNLVEEAKGSNAWQVLGFRSWTEYLADTLGAEPMRLAREERQELVAYLSGEGMSTRAIAPIVGATKSQVARDIASSGVPNGTPDGFEELSRGIDKDLADDELFDRVRRSAPADTPVIGYGQRPLTDDERQVLADQEFTPSREVTGRDGKTYTAPSNKPPQRKPLTDVARDAGWELRKAIERLGALAEDDRFGRNRIELAAHLRGHLLYTIETATELLDILTQETK